MKISSSVSLEKYSLFEEDLSVPGILNSDFCTQCVSDYSTGEIRELCKSIVRHHLEMIDTMCWICTLVSHPALMENMIRSGWLLEEDRILPFTSFIVWTVVPDPAALSWEDFWNVQIEFPFTNIVVASKPITITPPDKSLNSGKTKLSSLLRWPWFDSIESQTSWLSQINLKIFILGASDCTADVQIIRFCGTEDEHIALSNP